MRFISVNKFQNLTVKSFFVQPSHISFFFSSRRRHTRQESVSWARDVYKRQEYEDTIPKQFVRQETTDIRGAASSSFPSSLLPPCTDVNSESTIDLRSGQLTIPSITCKVESMNCSSLPMTFYSFSGKLAKSTSKQILT